MVWKQRRHLPRKAKGSSDADVINQNSSFNFVMGKTICSGLNEKVSLPYSDSSTIEKFLLLKVLSLLWRNCFAATAEVRFLRRCEEDKRASWLSWICLLIRTIMLWSSRNIKLYDQLIYPLWCFSVKQGNLCIRFYKSCLYLVYIMQHYSCHPSSAAYLKSKSTKKYYIHRSSIFGICLAILKG